MNSQQRSIVNGLQSLIEWTQKNEQNKEREPIDTKALEGRVESLEKSCLSLKDKAIQRERMERWPSFIHDIILRSEIKQTIRDGFSRGHTVEQIAHAIREEVRDLEKSFERR